MSAAAEKRRGLAFHATRTTASLRAVADLLEHYAASGRVEDPHGPANALRALAEQLDAAVVRNDAVLEQAAGHCDQEGAR
jgi:hypothetical protein